MTALSIEDQLKEQIQRAARELECPKDLSERVWESSRRPTGQTSVPRKPSGQTRLFRKAVIACAAAFLLTAALIASGFVSPVMAETLGKLPFVQNIFRLAGDWGLQSAVDKGLVKEVRISDTRNGFTLSAVQVLYDGTRASVALQLDEAGHPASLFSPVKDNGIVQQPSKSPGSFNRLEAQIRGAKGNVAWVLGPGADASSAIVTVSVASNESTRRPAMPDQYTLSLEISLNGIREPFQLDIPVRKNTSNRVLSLNTGKTFGKLSWKLDEMESSPVSTRLFLQTSGTTADGREMYFDVVDEQGKEAGWIDIYRYRLPDGRKQLDLLYEPLAADTKSITIKPFLYVYKDAPDNRIAEIDSHGNWTKEYIPELQLTIPLQKQ